MSDVTFKNITNDGIGAIVTDIGSRQRAMERVNRYDIPYRNGGLLDYTGRFDSYTRDMEFYTVSDAQRKALNAWLVGYDKLRTAKDLGGYFKAGVMSKLDYQAHVKGAERARVTFEITPPFFYLDSGDTPLILTAPATLTNLGTMYSEPYIKITGTGDVDLTIGSTTYSFTAIDGYIEVDSELMYVYKDTVNAGDKMVGDFPVFNIGDNAISWTGTVTEVRIIPRWREL